ncbi:glycosyltransferase family 4 protein [Flavobacterium sp. J27]|uniref:glycosyltransferase family 4 protein n=1 Tax=Flavobacterium sp. J27 TaxID=2060419 RepID=UPI001030DA36|nr:glycosyltransferase family 4 protein [Flavobacterium sp. J27]
MKIIFNTDQIYLHGGIEKVMTTKVNYFAQLPNVEVYIVTTEQKGNTSCYPLDARVQLIDLNINYNRSLSYFSKENIKKAISHFKKQKALFKELQPDVVISPNFNFDHYWLPFFKSIKKTIKERHSSRYFEAEQYKSATFMRKLIFMFNNWIDSKYSHIVVLNKDEAQYVKTNNAVVIPNPIDEVPFKADPSRKQVIAAGRIAPIKGFEQLIMAWKIINKEFPDWMLHIYGTDYLNTKKSLEEQIVELGLSNVVEINESVDNIPKIMQQYSIYALTSKTECFPTVLLESLAVGLPIVSYDCPNGPRHIITTNVDGILVENQNYEEFAKALKKMINDIDLRMVMSENGIKNGQRFKTENIMKSWISLLKL